MKDVLGRLIHEGDRLIYAVRRGNRAVLLIGTVLHVHTDCVVAIADGHSKPGEWCDERRMVLVR